MGVSFTPRCVLAVAAHPDDIEFTMAGTLVLLQRAGAAVHMWNLCSGNCGTETMDHDAIVGQRAAEARASAAILGATVHPAIADDLELLYEVRHLRHLAAAIREIQPDIILTQSPADYMEDHQNTCRLVVTAAFAKGMRNFRTEPPAAPWNGPVALYHAMPHGLRTGLRQLVRPELFVNVEPVLDIKRQMLAQHRSQKDWLDATQGFDSYLHEMERLGAEVGRLSGNRFANAEGWRRHSHLGFSPLADDPLAAALDDRVWVDPNYVTDLDRG